MIYNKKLGGDSMVTIGETLGKYRRAAGLSQKEAAEKLSALDQEISNKSISAWEKSTSSPSPKQFLLLCKIYGITDIYSVFIEPNPDNPFSILTPEGKEKALDYINILGMTDKYHIQTEETNKVISFPRRKLPLYLLPASAGSGEFLDGDEYELEEVGSEVPEKAHFGIRLNGDSMEPRYLNGQIVWVERTTDLLDGDIGIFYLDGNAYCKRLHKETDYVELISLNSKYDPIPITEANDFRVYGRVVS